MKDRILKFFRNIRPGILWYGVFCLLVVLLFAVLCLRDDSPVEIEGNTYGIDVARYQGTINWEKVSQSGVEFAMIRLGYRGSSDGLITEDSNARYNLQEAQKYGIKIGGYFFSTAINEAEAVEEAKWVAELLDHYAITYPVAYDCELFSTKDSRQYHLTVTQRTDIALAFLKQIEKEGYEGMFYGSKNDLTDSKSWEMDRIEKDYKVWVAQYPGEVDPATEISSYEGAHSMWQYTQEGMVAGIDTAVDMNVAYFGYEGTAKPKNSELPPEVKPDPEAMMDFTDVNEEITAKEEVNLRDIPSQGDNANVLGQLMSGEVAKRTGISESGWSRVEYQGSVYYCVSNLVTTDLEYDPNAYVDPDGVKTVFEPVNEQVTAKKAVNLRTIPSAEREDSVVVVKIKNGDVVTRTGINKDVGWSRVVYEGQVLYCISSYLQLVK